MNGQIMDDEPSALTTALYIIHEIIFILFALVGIFLDCLLIYTIARYARVRTVANVYIANWAVADILSLIFTPSAYDILEVLVAHLSTDVYVSVFHVLFLLGMAFHALVNVCVIIQLTDWIIQVFFPGVSQALRNYHKYVLASLWISFATIAILSIATCKVFSACYIEGTTLLVTLGIIGLLVVSLQLVVFARKCRNRPIRESTVRLTMATVFVVTWIIGFSNIIFVKWQFEHPLLSAVLDCVTFSTSFVNIALLYYYDVDFQACLVQVLKRSKYSEGIGDFNESVVVSRNVDVNNVM